MKKNYKVYIADDHTLFRKAMVNLLETFEGVSLVKDAENGRELLALMKNEIPDVAIVDLQMPIMDGAETCENIIEKFPGVKIIVLTMHDSDKYVLHMMEMGAHAFLLKNSEPEELEKAIHSVVEKDFYHNEWVVSIMRKNVRAKRPNFTNDDLTDREKQIVQLVCRELSSKEIADKLSVSERTVENHRSTIMKKLNVKNTIGLVHYAYQCSLM